MHSRWPSLKQYRSAYAKNLQARVLMAASARPYRAAELRRCRERTPDSEPTLTGQQTESAKASGCNRAGSGA
jgi:hypothetical protein